MHEPELRPSLADWTRLLQRRLGCANGFELAAKIGVHRNTIALIQSGKRPEPSVSTLHAILQAAKRDAPDMLANAPAIFEGLGLLDPGVLTLPDAMKGYTTRTKDSAVVAEDIDDIEDPTLRRRARNAALLAIDEIRSGIVQRVVQQELDSPRSEKKSSR